MILKFIGRAEADRLFPKESLFDREVAAWCRVVPIYGGLIGSIVRKLIMFGRSDSVIRSSIEHYPFEKEYEPDLGTSLIILMTLCLSDARIELAEFIFNIAYERGIKLRMLCYRSIELTYLHNKQLHENINVLEFLYERSMLSRYGYWGNIDNANEYVLYYILALRDDKLAEWATGKMNDTTVYGFGHGITFDLDELSFISKHSELFDQRGMIMKRAHRLAIQNNDPAILSWFVTR